MRGAAVAYSGGRALDPVERAGVSHALFFFLFWCENIRALARQAVRGGSSRRGGSATATAAVAGRSASSSSSSSGVADGRLLGGLKMGGNVTNEGVLYNGLRLFLCFTCPAMTVGPLYGLL